MPRTPGPFMADLDQRVQFLDTDQRIETVVEITTVPHDATIAYAVPDEAHRIVTACNSYDANIARIAALEAALRGWIETSIGDDATAYRAMVERTRRALAGEEGAL